MPKKQHDDYALIRELVQSLVTSMEDIDKMNNAKHNFYSIKKPIKKEVVIRTQDTKINAILSLMLGDNPPPPKLGQGNRPFYQKDVLLLARLLQEYPDKNKTEILGIAVGSAERRNKYKTKDESVRKRLEEAPWKEAKRLIETDEFIDFSADECIGMEDFDHEEIQLTLIEPWLKKYRTQLINYLNFI